MTPEKFAETLGPSRQPFTVELKNGERLEIDKPHSTCYRKGSAG